MADEQTDLAGKTGTSHGSPEREPHQMIGPLLTFDLTKEAGQLRREGRWGQHGSDAKTLVKEATFRIVLIALRNGATMAEHRAPGPISIQVLRGQIHIKAMDRTVPLSAGQLLALEAAVPHAVTALAESEFLLTIVAAEHGDSEHALTSEAP